MIEMQNLENFLVEIMHIVCSYGPSNDESHMSIECMSVGVIILRPNLDGSVDQTLAATLMLGSIFSHCIFIPFLIL